VQVGDWSAWRYQGVTPDSGIGTFPFNLVHSVYVDSKIAYVSYWDYGTVMLDVRNPRSPTFIGRTEFGEGAEGNAHSAWTNWQGDILVQTDEDFDPSENPDAETGWGYGHIYDVSDKANPVELSTLKDAEHESVPAPWSR
jgi:hypothetical protein